MTGEEFREARERLNRHFRNRGTPRRSHQVIQQPGERGLTKTHRHACPFVSLTAARRRPRRPRIAPDLPAYPPHGR